jgi:hypothetical protein
MYAKINTLEKHDLNDLFEVICNDIIGLPPLKVKMEKLGLNGSEKEIKKYEPNLGDILNLIAMYGVRFEFKIVYEKKLKDPSKRKDILDEAIASEVKPVVNTVEVSMKEQGKDVNIPEPTKNQATGSDHDIDIFN